MQVVSAIGDMSAGPYAKWRRGPCRSNINHDANEACIQICLDLLAPSCTQRLNLTCKKVGILRIFHSECQCGTFDLRGGRFDSIKEILEGLQRQQPRNSGNMKIILSSLIALLSTNQALALALTTGERRTYVEHNPYNPPNDNPYNPPSGNTHNLNSTPYNTPSSTSCSSPIPSGNPHNPAGSSLYSSPIPTGNPRSPPSASSHSPSGSPYDAPSSSLYGSPILSGNPYDPPSGSPHSPSGSLYNPSSTTPCSSSSPSRNPHNPPSGTPLSPPSHSHSNPPPASPTPECSSRSLAVPLLRAFSPSATDHFYTTSAAEMNNAVSSIGYTAEGNAGYVFANQQPNTVPLYRLFSLPNPDHFYTTSAPETDSAVTGGYQKEGIAGYIYSQQICGSVPLYRVWSLSATDHFYTAGAAERDNAVAHLGYADEGVVGYILPA